MNNTKNRNRFIIIILVIIFAIYGILRFNGYNNILVDRQIEKELAETVKTEQVKILKNIKVDDRRVTLFQYENKIGISISECIFGILCDPYIYYFGFDDQSIRDKFITTDEGSYMIIFGYNEDNYSIINYSVDHREYSSPLPFTEEYFVIYEGLPENTPPLEVIRDISFD